MNRTRDFISFAVVLAIAFGAASQFKTRPWSFGSEKPKALHRVESKRCAAIRIGNEWTSFRLSGNSNAIKLLTNAVVASHSADQNRPTRLDSREGHRYAIEYELLDEKGQLLANRVCHFRSTTKEKRDNESGEVVPAIQMAGFDGAVTQTRILETSIGEDIKHAREIRLRIGDTDDSVVDLLARVRCRSMRKNHHRFAAWNSISDQRKEQLAAHSVYDHRLLDDQSRQSLMKWRWNRATTVGDHDRRFLYFFGLKDSAEVTEEILPRGTIAQPEWKVVVPVGNEPTTLRVEAIPLTGEVTGAGLLKFRHEDPASSLEESGCVSFQQDGDSECSYVEIDGVIGLVELQVNQEVALRFFHGDSSISKSRWPEIEIENRCLPVYIANDKPVVYSVEHIDDDVTPLKVAFRFTEDQYMGATSSFEGNLDRQRHIRWRFIGDEGQILDEGIRELSPSVSTYERFMKDRFSFKVTDPIELWFPVGPDVSKVEFWSNESHALVNAYSRPNNLPARTRVPEDYNSFRSDSPNRRWFVIKPENFEQYASQNRVLNLKVQPRLADPEGDEVETRDLVWRRFSPTGDWVAARILVPATDPTGFKTEKRDSAWFWHELKSDEAVSWSTLERTSQYNNIQVAFLSDHPVRKLEIWNDEERIVSRTFASTRGEFGVKLPKDHGKLRVVTDDGVRVFVSGLKIDATDVWFRRTAMRVEQSPSVFEYEKTTQDDEYLTLVLYRHQSETSRAGLNAKILGMEAESDFREPLGAWTIRNRSYDISASPVADSLLMDRSGKLDSGSRCFIKLGSDLPQGRYKIEVQREDKQSGYLLLYQTTPSQNLVRQIGIHDNQDHH